MKSYIEVRTLRENHAHTKANGFLIDDETEYLTILAGETTLAIYRRGAWQSVHVVSEKE